MVQRIYGNKLIYFAGNLNDPGDPVTRIAKLYLSDQRLSAFKEI